MTIRCNVVLLYHTKVTLVNYGSVELAQIRCTYLCNGRKKARGHGKQTIAFPVLSGAVPFPEIAVKIAAVSPPPWKGVKSRAIFCAEQNRGGYLSKTRIASRFPICSYGYRTQTASNRIIFFFTMQRVYTILNAVLIPYQELSGNYNCVQEYPAAYHTKTHPANGCHTCYCL